MKSNSALDSTTKQLAETGCTSHFSNRSDRIDLLLILKGVACLAIVAAHCNIPRQSLLLFGKYDLTWLIYSDSLAAVWIFFTLSGYLIGKAFYTKRYSTSQSELLRFWRSRALRIMPLYYTMVLVVAIFVHPEVLKPEFREALIRVLTFTYHPFATTPPFNFNAPIWFISTQVQFYLLAPFLYLGIEKLLQVKNKRNLLLTILIIFATCFTIKNSIWIIHGRDIGRVKDGLAAFYRYWYTPIYTNIDIFLIGFLLNPLILLTTHKSSPQELSESLDDRPTSQRSLKRFACLVLTTWLVVAAYYRYHGGPLPYVSYWFFAVMTAATIAFFVYAFEQETYTQPFQKQAFSLKKLIQNPLSFIEFVGALSYGIYLWHYPIFLKIQPLIASSIPLVGFLTRFAIVLITSTLVAAITYYLIELPFARLKISAR
jgi:peptidoglycan/LPS O-acetylase OafA/YrhL